jgi:hypothetical protein
MTDSPSADLRTEIERRCDQATPGPWKSYVEGRDHTSGDSFIKTGGPDIYLIGGSIEDQDFIANARQDLPMLLREVKRLRSILAPDSRA